MLLPAATVGTVAVGAGAAKGLAEGPAVSAGGWLDAELLGDAACMAARRRWSAAAAAWCAAPGLGMRKATTAGPPVFGCCCCACCAWRVTASNISLQRRVQWQMLRHQGRRAFTSRRANSTRAMQAQQHTARRAPLPSPQPPSPQLGHDALKGGALRGVLVTAGPHESHIPFIAA